MADTKRKRTYQTDKTREKIRTTQLKNRLEAYALGENDPVSKEPVKMESGQVKAALGLMAKTLPDLTSADIHDSRQDESRTYEDIRIELIREHGEPLALLLLKEITQGQYLSMMQASLVKQTDSAKLQPSIDSEKVGKNVAPSHSLASDTAIPAQDQPNLLQ